MEKILNQEEKRCGNVSVENGKINERVADWLKRSLASCYKRGKVYSVESHNILLSSLIKDLGLQRFFPQSDAWEVKVNVTGITVENHIAHLSLIDLTSRKPNLGDVSRLLGYARAVNPVLCMLISTRPPVDSLITLLKDYGRFDVLEYGIPQKHIRIAQWDSHRNGIIPDSLIPPGRLL